ARRAHGRGPRRARARRRDRLAARRGSRRMSPGSTPPFEHVLVEEAAPFVRRITLNRPEKRNAISNALRGELLRALQEADGDDSVRVSIVRGAGPCFSSGYDLKSDLGAGQPYFTPRVGMQWARHVSEGWMSIWDLAKPVVAQIHGYAMAGGRGLAAAGGPPHAARSARPPPPLRPRPGPA